MTMTQPISHVGGVSAMVILRKVGTVLVIPQKYISPSRVCQRSYQNMVELHPIYGYIYNYIYICMIGYNWLTLVDTVTVHYWIINGMDMMEFSHGQFMG